MEYDNDSEYTNDVLRELETQESASRKRPNFNITNYKITPLQLAEIESHLELASFILNSEEIPDWEDLQTACRQIWDVREDLKMIREKTSNEISVF